MIFHRTTKYILFTAAFILVGSSGLLFTQQSARVAPMTAMLSFFVSPAHAVVGRPLTPVSYASVARRTARRTSYRHHYYGGAAVAGAAVVTAVAVGTMVATLPPACSTILVNGVTYHNCSGAYYVPSGSRWVVVAAP